MNCIHGNAIHCELSLFDAREQIERLFCSRFQTTYLIAFDFLPSLLFLAINFLTVYFLKLAYSAASVCVKNRLFVGIRVIKGKEPIDFKYKACI